jgi:fucose 4-O-acetylase-like acetyltransferase
MIQQSFGNTSSRPRDDRGICLLDRVSTFLNKKVGRNLENHKYIVEMQMARGMGIILVTLGHSEPIENAFPQVFNFIYSFHMPLFFFMSGFFSISKSSTGSIWEEYKKVVNRLFYLVVPYVVISLAFAFIKLGVPHLVKRTVVLEDAAANIFLYPTNNPALFLWFIYIIILMRLITPLLSKSNQYAVFLLLLFFQIFPVHIDLFGTGVMLQYLIYYYLGLKTSQISEGFQLLLKRRTLTIASLLLFLLSYFIYQNSHITLMRFTTASFGTLWILSTCFSLRDYLPVRWLEYCGKYSLQIYLLQYFFIFPLELLLVRMQINVGLIVLANFVIGLAGPLAVVKHVFPLNHRIALAFGGMREIKTNQRSG